MQFFALQSKRRLEREYLAYDTTSISSYSELIRQVRYGYNKDGEPLPQINLALVFGENSMLPVYYRKLPGNITDVKTVCKLLKDIAFLNISKVKLVMDRGFYSVDNVNALYRNHYKFLLSPRSNSTFLAPFLNAERENVRDYKNYSVKHDVYCLSHMTKWTYEQGKTLNSAPEETRRIYVHLYYNGQRAETEKTAFVRHLAEAEQALRDGTATEEQQRLGSCYFAMTGTGKSLRLEYDEKGSRERIHNCGYFALLSNEIKDPEVALEIYRNKDLVEKAFCNLKNRLGMKRTAVSSSENLEGKLFVQFISLIYISYIHKRMKERGLYVHYTIQTLLDELDVIERYQYSASKVHYSERTKSLSNIF
jgi:transposase